MGTTYARKVATRAHAKRDALQGESVLGDRFAEKVTHNFFRVPVGPVFGNVLKKPMPRCRVFRRRVFQPVAVEHLAQPVAGVVFSECAEAG